MAKPAWFKFYTSDWLGSPTVQSMNMKDRGIYITLLATAWASDPPGSLPADHKIAAKLAGLDPRLVTNFFHKYPHTFERSMGVVVNPKLAKLNEMNATIGNKIAIPDARYQIPDKGVRIHEGRTRADRSRANIQEAARKLGIPCPDLDAPFQLAVPKGTNQR